MEYSVCSIAHREVGNMPGEWSPRISTWEVSLLLFSKTASVALRCHLVPSLPDFNLMASDFLCISWQKTGKEMPPWSQPARAAHCNRPHFSCAHSPRGTACDPWEQSMGKPLPYTCPQLFCFQVIPAIAASAMSTHLTFVSTANFKPHIHLAGYLGDNFLQLWVALSFYNATCLLFNQQMDWIF